MIFDVYIKNELDDPKATPSIQRPAEPPRPAVLRGAERSDPAGPPRTGSPGAPSRLCPPAGTYSRRARTGNPSPARGVLRRRADAEARWDRLGLPRNP